MLSQSHKSVERYRERMAGVSEKVAGHLETVGPDDILNRASQLERFDPSHAGHLD
jgi:hypothetical protein